MVLMARSARRPISRKRQPAARAVHAFLRETGEASSCSVSSAALTTPSSSSTAPARRSTISVMTCQASGDSRSRSDVAVAARIAPATAPSRICPQPAALLRRPWRAASWTRSRSRPTSPAGAGSARPNAARSANPCRSRWVPSAWISRSVAPGALQIAAEPEQIVGGAARHHAGDAPDWASRCRRPAAGWLAKPSCRTPPRRRRPARRRPSIPRAGIGLVGDPAETAGHDGPAIGRRGREHPQHERPRRQAPVVPDRRRRQPDQPADIADADRDRANRSRSPGESSLASIGPVARETGNAPAVGALDGELVEPRQHFLADFGRNHQVAICGIFRSSPNKRRLRLGRKPSSARASITPEPGMLATTTPFFLTTSIRPGTPSCEEASSSSGSSERTNLGAAERRAVSGLRRCG